MNTKYSLALLASAVMARGRLDTSGSAEFQEFIGTFNKEYGTTDEMNDRMQVWLENKKIVDGLNAANADTGVTFGMNETGDMTDEEFAKMQGLSVPPQDESSNSNDSNKNGNGRLGGRRLQNDQSINWVTQGKVGAVKNQGQCGSCWAFAATTVQESKQSIKNGQPPVRLSEQEGVDCDPASSGCGGGWMSYYWNMSADIGSQPNSTYQYEARDGACRNQAGKPIASRATRRGDYFVRGLQNIKDALQDGPLTVAVSAGNSCWRYYQSGILSEENNCPTAIDHGVALVGLVESGDKPYWIIQNSWGTGWGQSGFIHIAVEEGHGTSAMNTYIEQVDVDEGYPQEGEDIEPDCGHDESLNPLGPHKCSSDDECEGFRYCSEWGWCHGESGCDDKEDKEEEEEEEEEDGSPDPEPDMCKIDEDFNDLGPGRCDSDDQCKGDRVCCPEMNYCVGYSNCPDDEEQEMANKCKINESKNPLGPHQCTRSDQCKGARWCEEGFCQGKSTCDDDELTPQMRCQVNELQNFGGENRCWQNDDDCRGERTCGEDGFCTGYCGCK